MSIICINGWRPSEVYDEFKKSILEGRIRPSDYKKVIIDYDCYEWPAAEGTPEFYPIKFIGNENELWLSQITTGEYGEASDLACTIFRIMGFYIAATEAGFPEYELIFGKKRKVKESYYKDLEMEAMLDMAINFDEMCAVSERLISIDLSNVTKDTILMIENEVENLKWDGQLVRGFRKNMFLLTKALRKGLWSDSLSSSYYSVANVPRQYAKKLQDSHLIE